MTTQRPKFSIFVRFVSIWACTKKFQIKIKFKIELEQATCLLIR